MTILTGLLQQRIMQPGNCYNKRSVQHSLPVSAGPSSAMYWDGVYRGVYHPNMASLNKPGCSQCTRTCSTPDDHFCVYRWRNLYVSTDKL